MKAWSSLKMVDDENGLFISTSTKENERKFNQQEIKKTKNQLPSRDEQKKEETSWKWELKIYNATQRLWSAF